MFAHVFDPLKSIHCVHVCVGVRNNILASLSMRTHTQSTSPPQWFCVCTCICDKRWLLYNSHTCVRKHRAVDVVSSSSWNQILFDNQYMTSVMLMLICMVMMTMVVLMFIAMCVVRSAFMWFENSSSYQRVASSPTCNGSCPGNTIACGLRLHPSISLHVCS